MINRRQPVEFGINMNLLGMIITQQQDLDAVAKLNYFTDSDPCHIYLLIVKNKKLQNLLNVLNQTLLVRYPNLMIRFCLVLCCYQIWIFA